MLARACFDLGAEAVAEGNKPRAQDLFAEGLGYASAVVKSGAKNADAYKWNTVLLAKLGDFSSQKEKIQNTFKIKELGMKVAELDPNDAVTQHLLGAWCYQVASLTWIERTVASTLFAAPPKSSFEEAEKYLRRANEIDPSVFETLDLLGDLCAATDRPHEAKQWYEKILKLEATTEKEKAFQTAAAKKQQGL